MRSKARCVIVLLSIITVITCVIISYQNKGIYWSIATLLSAITAYFVIDAIFRAKIKEIKDRIKIY